jgi:hypothetical protein
VVVRPPAAAPAATTAPQPATLLLDLAPVDEAPAQTDVGVLQVGGRLLHRGFAEPVRCVRLEGLVPGPATVWVRIGDGPTHFLGGALATTTEEPPLHPLRAAAKTFTLEVRRHDGAIAESAFVSLGEPTPKGKKPFTAALLPVQPDQSGQRLTLTVRLLGDIWVVVHGADGQRRDVLLQSDGGPPVVTVALPPPAPKPDEPVTDKAGDKKDC